MNHYILENGVEVVLKNTTFSDTVTMQVWVGVGSVHENDAERGMSHYLEHMLFKGTKKYGPGEIASTVEMCGGEINAYTTFDNTVYYLTLNSDHAHDGLDLLFEAVAHSKIDETEFNREKEVILEEIRRSNDSPGSKVGRRVFELAFHDTQAALPIIGSSQSVSAFTRDQVFNYYKKWYVPNNMRIIVVGKFHEQEMLDLISTTFGGLKKAQLPFVFNPLEIYENRKPNVENKGDKKVSVLKGDFKQTRLEIVFPAPYLEHPDTMALDIASFALGTGEMGRLTRRLRDELGLVSSIGASVFSPVFGGIFEFSALLEEKDLVPTLQAIEDELTQFLTDKPITDEELARARATLRVDRIYRDETVDGQARSIGFGLKTKLRMHFDAVSMAMMEGITRSEIHGAAKRWLSLDNARIVVLVNDDSKLKNADLEGVLKKSATKLVPTYFGAVLEEAEKDSQDVKRFKITNGITLLTKQNTNIPLFTLVGASRGGIREEERKEAGVYNFLAGMLATATKSMDFDEFVGTVEAHGASLEGFSGKDSFGIHAQCAIDDFQIFLPMVIKSLLEPVFPEEQFDSLKREISQALIRQKDSPSSVCFRRLQEMIYGDRSYSWPVAGLEDTVQKITPDSLMKFYETCALGRDWVFSVVSPFDHETTHSIMEPFLKQLADKKQSKPNKPEMAPLDIRDVKVERLVMEREQSHIAVGFQGLTWGHSDRPALDVLINVLGGHGGRLFRELRDKESFAYTVSPIISYGCESGIVGAYIACAPAKSELALKRLLEEIQKIVDHPPEAIELKRSVNYIVGSHAMGLQKCDSQASTMALMELYGYGFDDFKSYPDRIKKVTAAEVQKVAKKVFTDKAYRAVIVGPSQIQQ